MSTPSIKIGFYGANVDTVGTGIVRSLALGFVPDWIQIQSVTNPTNAWAATPGRINFSNGTAVRIYSAAAALGATGNNQAYSANGLLGGAKSGSYVMVMGGARDTRSPATKQRGVYLGKKLNTDANYFYIAMRSGPAEIVQSALVAITS